jgi:hypothetical protein
MDDDARLVSLEANVAGLSSVFIDLAAIIHDVQPKAIEELLGKRRALVQQLEADDSDVPALQALRIARDLLQRAVSRNA